jgi:hypothetical protein
MLMIEARIRVTGAVLVLALGCGDNSGGASDGALSRLMDDGDVGAVAPGLTSPPPPMTAPPRCPGGDCSGGSPLAFWKMDDCNSLSTQLIDSANSSPITHPAFRAVSAACVASIDGFGIQLAGTNDIVYAPDEPDFVFDQGLTVAAWIDLDSTSGTQSIFRKRLDSSSAFVLAIDGGKLTFALRLTSGKKVGVSAPIKPKRYTHVAATYDGAQAVLYVNGTVAASAKASGTIAPGAGPVFIGNDASGRELAGIVDDVWLSTVAAPASVIQGLTCIRNAPTVALTPAATPAQTAGTSVPFDLAITNSDTAACPVDTFEVFPATSAPLMPTYPGSVDIAPGQTVHLTVDVASSTSATVGSYPLQYFVYDESNYQAQASAQAVYVIGTGPVPCHGTQPLTPLITGSSSSPVGSPPGGIYTYAAPGLIAPSVTTLLNGDGTTQGLQVTASPGASNDPNSAYAGLGMGFGNPGCVDASAYTGVQFTIAGDLGTCTLQLELVPSEDNSTQYSSLGACTEGAMCVGPFSLPLGVGTTIVNLSDMTGGVPLATVDATTLNDIGWNLMVPTDGVTVPCVANFTITNISFVGGAGPTATPDAGVSGLPPPHGFGGAPGGAGGAP